MENPFAPLVFHMSFTTRLFSARNLFNFSTTTTQKTNRSCHKSKLNKPQNTRKYIYGKRMSTLNYTKYSPEKSMMKNAKN